MQPDVISNYILQYIVLRLISYEYLSGRAHPRLSRLVTGETALHFAMVGNSLEVVRSLIEAGCNVNACTSDKSTPLHFAAEFNSTDLVDILLQHPLCNPDMLDANDHTPAQVAQAKGYTQLAIKLGCGGADADVVDARQRIPSVTVSSNISYCFYRDARYVFNGLKSYY